MADDLEENYEIEESYLNVKKRSGNEEALFDEDVERDLGKEQAKKQHKKKNITEILELRKEEISKPAYARNELVRILRDYVEKKLSVVEKNDLNLSSEDGASQYFNKLVLKRKFTRLPLKKQFEKRFDAHFQRHLDKGKFKNGQPFAIVLCSSAIRCVEVQKELAAFTGKRVRWMHAFAKHKKLAEQIDYLKKNKVNLVFATPNRLVQLLSENEAAFRSRFFKLLKYLIVDYTHRDCKLKRFIDVNEIKADFLKLFFTYIQPVNGRQANNKVKIKVYLV